MSTMRTMSPGCAAERDGTGNDGSHGRKRPTRRRLGAALVLSAGILAAAGGGGATAQEPSRGADADPADMTERMAEVAGALLETTGDGSITDALYGFSQRERLALDGNAPARRDWSYWPRPREGLPLRFMTAEQRRLTHDLLASALSVKGYLKVTHIMKLEEVLAALETTPLPRDVAAYTVAIFGTPSLDAPWAWRFEGHHVSLNITVDPEEETLRVTPSFLGANPAEVQTGPMAGFRPLRLEEDLGYRLVTALDEAQRRRAILGDEPPGDIVSTNIFEEREAWDDWREQLRPDGLPVAEMTPSQRRLVRRILDEVVTTYRPEVAEDYLRRIVVDDLHFAWIGTLEDDAPHYYRIQGPDFVFEYDDTQGDANHIHSVWRSRADDFGGDLLERHYDASHR